MYLKPIVPMVVGAIVDPTRDDGGSGPPIDVLITGIVSVGQTLTCTALDAIAFQWQRAVTFGGGGAWADIPGEIGDTHVVAPADMGYSLRCVASDPEDSTPSNVLISITDLASYAPSLLVDDRGLTIGGGLISRIADQSGNGRDFVQATMADQPSTDILINGLQAWHFDGVRFMQNGALLRDVITDHSFDIFVVMRPDNPAAASWSVASYWLAQNLVCDYGANVSIGVGMNGLVPSLYVGAYDTAGRSIALPIVPGTTVLAEARLDANVLGLRVGASAESTTAMPGPIVAGGMTYPVELCSPVTGQRFQGPAAMVCVFPSLQTPSVRADIRALIGNKYSVVT